MFASSGLRSRSRSRPTSICMMSGLCLAVLRICSTSLWIMLQMPIVLTLPVARRSSMAAQVSFSETDLSIRGVPSGARGDISPWSGSMGEGCWEGTAVSAPRKEQSFETSKTHPVDKVRVEVL